MIYGQRYTRNRFRCRAVTGVGSQCKRPSTGAVCGVCLCTAHRRGMKNGIPFPYVDLQPENQNSNGQPQ